MSCLHLYDFVTGARITLAIPPCQTAGPDEGGADFFDIVRPNRRAAEMFEQHLALLAAVRRDEEVGEES